MDGGELIAIWLCRAPTEVRTDDAFDCIFEALTGRALPEYEGRRFVYRLVGENE